MSIWVGLKDGLKDGLKVGLEADINLGFRLSLAICAQSNWDSCPLSNEQSHESAVELTEGPLQGHRQVAPLLRQLSAESGLQVSELQGQMAGIDEVGRGPLAGPVVAAAVILNPAHPIPGLADSKKLSAAKRVALAREIKRHATCYAIASASIAEIETLNILGATLLAMSRACAGLSVMPSCALVDGNRLPKLAVPALAIVKGDSKVDAISAASIIAKVSRDRLMSILAHRYPGYGFERHSGYGTKAHLQALTALGPCPAHRPSFAPVRKAQESASP